MEAKERGAKIIAVSSVAWQKGLPADYELRHPSKKNLNDFADVCIDDYNPLGDTAVKLDGFETPIGPISNMTDFYIVHRLEIECAKVCLSRGIEPPFWLPVLMCPAEMNLIRRILKNIAAGSKCSNRRGPLNGRKLC